ncbi:MAG TPA: UDP-glucose 4-epimerase GalE [Methylomirabilota bacterium]|nr:UDP-glucose 4-epimerase GalE [Methylomirabilota bacterium]
MKVVVTGGAGYIGSNVAALLIEAGHDVIVLDNLSNGYADAVPEGARFVEADVADFGTVFSKDDKVEAVLHFGAFIAAGESVVKPELYWQNNTVKSLKLLEALNDLGIKKLIFSSTAAVYGNPETVPIKEDAAKNPTSPYGMTKLAADMAISGEAIAHGLAATSLRYFNVAGANQKYGERHEPETHIIPLALRAADTNSEFTLFGNDYPTEDGTCVRDYIHVRDLAQAHLLALENLEVGKHTIYNLGNGQGFSNQEVVKVVETVTGKPLKLKIGARRAGDPAILVASSVLAKDKLGWKPEKPALEDIIGDAWEFYQSTQQ